MNQSEQGMGWQQYWQFKRMQQQCCRQESKKQISNKKCDSKTARAFLKNRETRFQLERVCRVVRPNPTNIPACLSAHSLSIVPSTMNIHIILILFMTLLLNYSAAAISDGHGIVSSSQSHLRQKVSFRDCVNLQNFLARILRRSFLALLPCSAFDCASIDSCFQHRPPNRQRRQREN
jgi:hypothetical protein